MNAANSPKFPPSRDSVLADMLADLLEGKKPTGLSVWREQGSSRAAHHKWELKHKYDWPIETETVAKGTSDGRVSDIECYYLPPEVITQAFSCGAEVFIKDTRLARARKRQRADEKRRLADSINVRRAK